ncbi:hypothetical protein CN188_09685 [Sinorhizobium meliloti]|uniref:hypothetical protein n=1 Tax=Rhizobium meliloti TaxID=382 RepID=UPI000FD6E4BA|nr:hypothetical protein [Sinorhizobium meliloti]RVI83930.1 hypothetical protein CN188_09685 [Sinorhizobium meliloti]
MALVSLDDLDFQLRLDLSRDGSGTIDDPLAPQFQKLADRASVVVLRHVKREDDPWSEADAPDDIRAATLIVARNLWDEVDEPLSEAVVNLLRGRRDPTLA